MNNHQQPVLKFVKADPKAITPTKGHPSDAGYDLTILRKYKDLDDTTALYDTGICIQIDKGYYTELFPRSSISKSGYAFANSVGVIDSSYRGRIYVALRKSNPKAPDIQFPYRCAQLIIRKQYSASVVEVDSLEDTVRGDGGFGSTGN